MKFPKYWKKGTFIGKKIDGKEITIEAFGWSFESLEEAQKYGTERAKRAIEAIIQSDNHKSYGYGDTPFREEVISQINFEGQEIGIISRAPYGALILNSPNVLFVDIDLSEKNSETTKIPFEPPKSFFTALFQSFSSKPSSPEKPKVLQTPLQKIESWALQNPSKSFRLYRTHSGFRLLFTDSLYEPRGSETKRIFQELESDPLYQKLTERQECFRARLTPKPWRCNLDRSPYSFPWENEKAEGFQRQWEKDYHQKIPHFDTCILLKEYGKPNSTYQEIARVTEIHDKFTLGNGTSLA